MSKELYIRILDNIFDVKLRIEELRATRKDYDNYEYCWLLSRLKNAKTQLEEALYIMEGFYPDYDDKSPFEEGETDEQQEDTIIDEA